MLASFAACQTLQPNQTNSIYERKLYVHHAQDSILYSQCHLGMFTSQMS